ncbi:hypothetical protein Lepto7375DRAFT_7715 [Leptolyngbya sp. PCC 7375]|nr:hypothetical protein Lepto7375DRAFT_7715 [Leptolyngbya sp. PCC 7375]
MNLSDIADPGDDFSDETPGMIERRAGSYAKPVVTHA